MLVLAEIGLSKEHEIAIIYPQSEELLQLRKYLISKNQ
jgi:hypothetical protein